ncbi:MAG: metallophosphoesterase [Bacteroidetes bacterium]|nr:MAG: metallophosphoesterase [Bacteroidota bacterium]
MRKIFQFLLVWPVTWMANKFSSRPDQARVYTALTGLLEEIHTKGDKYGPIVEVDISKDKWIVFSDQHKGAKNGADDFMSCEKNYLAALDFYNDHFYRFISLGDNEELWENTIYSVMKKNVLNFAAEKKFLVRNSFLKVFGNHDLYWANDPLAKWQLKKIYGQKVKIYEGVILRIQIGDRELLIYLTHGHQGDKQSDGNWFSKWFVTYVWGPLQGYLQINPNTPATNDVLKTEHNTIMYEWSALQQGLVLITGHTHQPVFESLTHVERLYKKLSEARLANDEDQVKLIEPEIIKRSILDQEGKYEKFLKLKPSYFNTGCCCFNDGDITGIEIADGKIRLIKWTTEREKSIRIVLEEKDLHELSSQL